MGNWWDAAPVVAAPPEAGPEGDSWWKSAPLAQEPETTVDEYGRVLGPGVREGLALPQPAQEQGSRAPASEGAAAKIAAMSPEETQAAWDASRQQMLPEVTKRRLERQAEAEAVWKRKVETEAAVQGHPDLGKGWEGFGAKLSPEQARRQKEEAALEVARNEKPDPRAEKLNQDLLQRAYALAEKGGDRTDQQRVNTVSAALQTAELPYSEEAAKALGGAVDAADRVKKYLVPGTGPESLALSLWNNTPEAQRPQVLAALYYAVKRYDEQGEKPSWLQGLIAQARANFLKTGHGAAFLVPGKRDQWEFQHAVYGIITDPARWEAEGFYAKNFQRWLAAVPQIFAAGTPTGLLTQFVAPAAGETAAAIRERGGSWTASAVGGALAGGFDALLFSRLGRAVIPGLGGKEAVAKTVRQAAVNTLKRYVEANALMTAAGLQKDMVAEIATGGPAMAPLARALESMPDTAFQSLLLIGPKSAIEGSRAMGWLRSQTGPDRKQIAAPRIDPVAMNELLAAENPTRGQARRATGSNLTVSQAKEFADRARAEAFAGEALAEGPRPAKPGVPTNLEGAWPMAKEASPEAARSETPPGTPETTQPVASEQVDRARAAEPSKPKMLTRFKVEAMNRDGEEFSGPVDAATEAEAHQAMRDQGYFVTKIKATRKKVPTPAQPEAPPPARPEAAQPQVAPEAAPPAEPPPAQAEATTREGPLDATDAALENAFRAAETPAEAKAPSAQEPPVAAVAAPVKKLGPERSALAYARENSLPPKNFLVELHDAQKSRQDAVEADNAALKGARQATGLDHNAVARIENAGFDHASAWKMPGKLGKVMRHFDVNTRNFAREHPERFPDVEAADVPAQVWEMLREPLQKRVPLNDPELMRATGERLRTELEQEGRVAVEKVGQEQAQAAERNANAELQEAAQESSGMAEPVQNVAELTLHQRAAEARGRAKKSLRSLTQRGLFANPADPETLVKLVRATKDLVEASVLTFADAMQMVVQEIGREAADRLEPVFRKVWNGYYQRYKPEGMEPIGPEQPALPEAPVTGIRNALTDQLREEVGLGRIDPVEATTFQEALDWAQDAIRKDPQAPAKLIAEVLKKPRALTPGETAVVTVELTRARNLRNQAVAEANAAADAGDPVRQAKAQTDLEAVEGKIDQITRAVNRGGTGTESGRSLAFRKMLLQEDFSLGSLREQARAAKGGQEPTPEEAAEIRQLAEKVANLEKLLDEALKERAAKNREKSTGENREKSTGENRGKPGASSGGNREKRIEASIERQVARLETDLAEGRLGPAEPGAKVTSREIEYQRKRLADLKRWREELRSGDAEYQAKIAAAKEARYEKLLRKRRSAWLDRLDRASTEPGAEFAKREKPPRNLNEKVVNLQFEIEKLKEHWVLMRGRWERQQRTLVRKVADVVPEALNLSRAILTSIDLSAVLRQGALTAASHPIITLRAMKPMLEALVSKKGLFRLQRELASRANAKLYREAGLSLTDPSAKLSAQEEAFMSRLSQRIPGVAASERAYVAFLNRIRADLFDSMISSLAKRGEPTLAEAQAIANFVNVSTGRGSLGKFQQAAVPLATVFFAPRYVVSRFQFLLGQPLWKGSARTRGLVAKEYARILGGAGMYYGTVALVSALWDQDDPNRPRVETDPRSSDFLKVRIGNTRIDPLAGLSQTTVLLARTLPSLVGATPKRKNARGKLVALAGAKRPYGGSTVWDVMGRFARSKFSPVIGNTVDILAKENLVGEKVTPGSVTVNMTVPLAMRDVYEAMQEQGIPKGAALTLLSIFGQGLQTYEPRRKKRR